MQATAERVATGSLAATMAEGARAAGDLSSARMSRRKDCRKARFLP